MLLRANRRKLGRYRGFARTSGGRARPRWRGSRFLGSPVLFGQYQNGTIGPAQYHCTSHAAALAATQYHDAVPRRSNTTQYHGSTNVVTRQYEQCYAPTGMRARDIPVLEHRTELLRAPYAMSAPTLAVPVLYISVPRTWHRQQLTLSQYRTSPTRYDMWVRHAWPTPLNALCVNGT
eukprot:3428634-Rhodomonas_salina.2